MLIHICYQKYFIKTIDSGDRLKQEPGAGRKKSVYKFNSWEGERNPAGWPDILDVT